MLSNFKQSKLELLVKENNRDVSYLYKYYQKEIKVNDEITKKIYICDIRNMSDAQLKVLFDNFWQFKKNLLADDFFKHLFYSNNMDLIFLYDKNRKYNINRNQILYDMDYSFKYFMDEEELNYYLSNYKDRNIDNAKRIINLSEQKIKLDSLNYINGNNGSGKTKILNEISSVLSVPVFNMTSKKDLIENIEDKDAFQKYLYQLTGYCEIDEYSRYYNYAYKLAKILEYSKNHQNIVLLDDLGWNSLDDRNKLNVLETLSLYSLDNEGVVLTGCNESNLIRKRVYKANVIEL